MVEERAVLVVDVGGSHVKVLASGESERRRDVGDVRRAPNGKADYEWALSVALHATPSMSTAFPGSKT